MTNICFVPPIELSKSASSIPWGRLGQQNPAQNKENAKILVSSHTVSHGVAECRFGSHDCFAHLLTVEPSAVSMLMMTMK